MVVQVEKILQFINLPSKASTIQSWDAGQFPKVSCHRRWPGSSSLFGGKISVREENAQDQDEQLLG